MSLVSRILITVGFALSGYFLLQQHYLKVQFHTNLILLSKNNPGIVSFENVLFYLTAALLLVSSACVLLSPPKRDSLVCRTVPLLAIFMSILFLENPFFDNGFAINSLFYKDLAIMGGLMHLQTTAAKDHNHAPKK